MSFEVRARADNSAAEVILTKGGVQELCAGLYHGQGVPLLICVVPVAAARPLSKAIQQARLIADLLDGYCATQPLDVRATPCYMRLGDGRAALIEHDADWHLIRIVSGPVTREEAAEWLRSMREDPVGELPPVVPAVSAGGQT